MKRFLILLLAFSLTSCFSIKYEPVTVDSYPPVNAAKIGKCQAQLQTEKICLAQIYADRWKSFTGIKVGAGESYCVTVPPDQVWFDKDRRNTAPYGEKGSLLMNLAQKRHKGIPFFSLMINVDRGNDGGDMDGSAVEVTDSKDFRFTSKVAGTLVLYPNDAIGPDTDPAYWYRNNGGRIWITIQRCDAAIPLM